MNVLVWIIFVLCALSLLSSPFAVGLKKRNPAYTAGEVVGECIKAVAIMWLAWLVLSHHILK